MTGNALVGLAYMRRGQERFATNLKTASPFLFLPGREKSVRTPSKSKGAKWALATQTGSLPPFLLRCQYAFALNIISDGPFGRTTTSADPPVDHKGSVPEHDASRIGGQFTSADPGSVCRHRQRPMLPIYNAAGPPSRPQQMPTSAAILFELSLHVKLQSPCRTPSYEKRGSMPSLFTCVCISSSEGPTENPSAEASTFGRTLTSPTVFMKSRLFPSTQ